MTHPYRPHRVAGDRQRPEPTPAPETEGTAWGALLIGVLLVLVALAMLWLGTHLGHVLAGPTW